MTFMAKQTTLREAVLELVERGCTDPMTIMGQLSERYGQPWLLRQMMNVVATIAANGSVEYGSAHRRRVVETTPGTPRVQRAAGDDVFSGSVWVEGTGWVVLSRLSASDCRTVSRQYARLEEAAGRHRAWFLQAAETIESQDALTLGEVRDLLVLPTRLLELSAAS